MRVENYELASWFREAETLYGRGDFDRAISLQQRALAASGPAPKPDAFLRLSTFLFAKADYKTGETCLREASAIWPDNDRLVEARGVHLFYQQRWAEAKSCFEQALRLGARRINLLDGLCSCCYRLGELENATLYGRRSLEAKNQNALKEGVKYLLPESAARPLSPNSNANIIAYSLWGEADRYVLPLLENLRIAPHLFPKWSIRIYLDDTVPARIRDQLSAAGATLIPRKTNVPVYDKLLWRFAAANDSHVDRFLIRDADALLTVKERVAVDAWVASARYFHIMRDHHYHTDLILAGMWGGIGNVLPELSKLFTTYRSKLNVERNLDQQFLGRAVWPIVTENCIIHDSVFTGCLDSVPFPPYGHLPDGEHIGDSALLTRFKTMKELH